MRQAGWWSGERYRICVVMGGLNTKGLTRSLDMMMMTFADPTMRTRSNSYGLVRNAFERMMETRDRQTRRRSASTTSLYGAERLNISQVERQSLFDSVAPERR